MAECETCVFYNAESHQCGAYEMPAEAARAHPLLCGDAGAEHVLREAPPGEGLMIVLGMVAVLLLTIAHGIGILT